MDHIIHNAYEVLVEGRVCMRERNALKTSPSKGSEAERKSMETFRAIRKELRFYLIRSLLLETILADNGIPIPECDD